jgi:tetratricopeptide (TPR) repeat protein
VSTEPETPEQYRQRALLLADLGRYDEAAGELTAGLAAFPGDAALLTTLARLHLAADQPEACLRAADQAAAVAPEESGPLLLRAMALVELRRFGDAAQLAVEALRRWPVDPYTQRAGAAVLSESRNGQDALDAAWRAVSLQPTDPEAHLVLSVVAARLRMFDLAQRAYAEALDLDASLAEAQQDVGVVRLERRRWARALEGLAEAATLAVPAGEAPDVVRPELHLPENEVVARVRRAVRVVATSVLIAGVATAFMMLASGGASRVFAGVLAAAGLAGLLGWAGSRLGRDGAGKLWRTDRLMAGAWYTLLAATVLVLVYALVGGPWPLAAALTLAAVAELIVVFHRPPG